MQALNLTSLSAAIEQQNRENPVSGVINVSQAEKPIFSQAYGYANRSEGLPNRLNTRFGIASGGKLITATAIAMLAEQKLVAFDQPLLDFLSGELPWVDSRVTLRQLLSHTSGIADYFDENLLDDYEDYWQNLAPRHFYHMRNAQDFIPLVEHSVMQFTPGEKFSYNNMAFVLLGLVIERVTGCRFQQFIEEKVFGPAWMRSSGYFFNNQLPQHTALGYVDQKDGGWHTNQFSIPITGHGDGGVYTTAADFGRFWKALFELRYFGETMLAEVLTPQIKVSQDGETQYGLGVWINDIAPVRCYYVTGEDPGVNFYSAVYPHLQLQITLLGNTNDAIWPMSRMIRAAIFDL